MATLLGEKLKTLRTGRKLSLQDLADQSGSSKSYIWELENRDLPKPSGEKLAAIARVLDVTVDYLLDEGTTVPDTGTKDKVFFRNYQKLPEGERERVRQMVAAWAKNP